MVDPPVNFAGACRTIKNCKAASEQGGALNKIGKAYSNLEQEFEREPSATELATELEMDVSEVADTLKISGGMFQWTHLLRREKTTGYWM